MVAVAVLLRPAHIRVVEVTVDHRVEVAVEAVAETDVLPAGNKYKLFYD